MLQRFLTLASIPELRPDPLHLDQSTPELEVIIPIDVYWEIQSIIHKLRYARISGLSTDRLWRDFLKYIYPCIVFEKDRQWFLSRIKLPR